eukprot:scaffold5048_cov338-Prasinococcus_capsulatus_cf.AAC.6
MSQSLKDERRKTRASSSWCAVSDRRDSFTPTRACRDDMCLLASAATAGPAFITKPGRDARAGAGAGGAEATAILRGAVDACGQERPAVQQGAARGPRCHPGSAAAGSRGRRSHARGHHCGHDTTVHARAGGAIRGGVHDGDGAEHGQAAGRQVAHLRAGGTAETAAAAARPLEPPLAACLGGCRARCIDHQLCDLLRIRKTTSQAVELRVSWRPSARLTISQCAEMGDWLPAAVSSARNTGGSRRCCGASALLRPRSCVPHRPSAHARSWAAARLPNLTKPTRLVA